MPPPPRAAIVALERSGRHKIVAGDVLLVTGSALAIAGGGLLIADAAEDRHCTRFYYGHYYGYANGTSYWSCPSAFGFAGAITLSLGVAALVPGVIIRGQGSRELATARHLRRGGCCAWSLRPNVGTRGALAELAITF
jgi:hypothetical protein